MPSRHALSDEGLSDRLIVVVYSVQEVVRMSKVIQAVYENGVFKPMEKVELREHQQVELVLTEMASVTQRTQGILKGLDDAAIHDIALSPEFLPEES
jgi:predicted DNA-binding antitoxin AbrB/MazE fold protein